MPSCRARLIATELFAAPLLQVCAVIICITPQTEQAHGMDSMEMSMGLLHAVCHASPT